MEWALLYSVAMIASNCLRPPGRCREWRQQLLTVWRAIIRTSSDLRAGLGYRGVNFGYTILCSTSLSLHITIVQIGLAPALPLLPSSFP